MTEQIQKLSTVVEAISTLLGQVTGLPELSRKTIAYYTLATYTVESVSTFPLLVLIGPMATGKSQTLLVVKTFAYNSLPLSPRGYTAPAIRDELAKCHNGTAIIEEGDAGWRDSTAFEALISDRYQRESARAAVKVPSGDGWDTKLIEYFGATVMHRRIPFGDPALDGRSIFVNYRAKHDRKYIDFSSSDPLVAEVQELIKNSGFCSAPESISRKKEPGMAGRILDSYGPVLDIAQLFGDAEFIEQIKEPIELRTRQLKKDQSFERDGLVVRALIECMSTGGGGLSYGYIRVKDLRASISANYNVELQPRQIAGIARELGFQTKENRGYTVIVPTATALVSACDQVGYDDEVIAALRERLEGSTQKPLRGPDSAG